MDFGVLIIGDEILSGKRQDKHLASALPKRWAAYWSCILSQNA